MPIHRGTYYPLRPGRSRPALLTSAIQQFRRYGAELALSVELHVLPLGGSVEILWFCLVLVAAPNDLGASDEGTGSHTPFTQSPPRRTEALGAQVQP